MTTERWIILTVVLLFAIAQYALILYAARDLVRRPEFQHGNRVSWGLLLLAVPFIGPLIYMVAEAPMLLEPEWTASLRTRFSGALGEPGVDGEVDEKRD